MQNFLSEWRMDSVQDNSVRRGGDTLWALTSGQRARYAAAIGAMGIGTVFLLSVPYIIKTALDALGKENVSLWRTIVPAAAAIVGFNAMHGLFTYLRGRWAAEASEGIVRRLRHELYSHLERLPAAYHDRADTGDLVQRCSSDVETVRVFLAAQVVEIARVTLFLLIAIPIMVSQNLRMTALVRSSWCRCCSCSRCCSFGRCGSSSKRSTNRKGGSLRCCRRT